MDSYNATSVYNLPSSSGTTSAAGNVVGNPTMPSLEDIAGYNYLSPQLQQQQKEQLQQTGKRQFSGNPRQLAQTPSKNILAPITPTMQPMTITADSLQYMNGFMRTQIGRPVTVDFLIGTNTLVDKTGTLLGVGTNYILINEIETDDIVACDFYTIKFIKFYY